MSIDPWQLYQTVFQDLLQRFRQELGTHKKFRFKNPLVSLDASVIDLCATLYDWAKFRRAKGGIKLHLLLDHDGYLPKYAVIEAAKKPELKVARQLRLEAGTIVVFLGSEEHPDTALGTPREAKARSEGLAAYINKRFWVLNGVDVRVVELPGQDTKRWPRGAKWTTSTSEGSWVGVAPT